MNPEKQQNIPCTSLAIILLLKRWNKIFYFQWNKVQIKEVEMRDTGLLLEKINKNISRVLRIDYQILYITELSGTVQSY